MAASLRLVWRNYADRLDFAHVSVGDSAVREEIYGAFEETKDDGAARSRNCLLGRDEHEPSGS